MRSIIQKQRHRLMTAGFIAIFVGAASYAAFLSIQQGTTAHAGAPACTWTGAAGVGTPTFSTASNWSCDEGSVPVDGTTLIFPISATQRVARNDLSASVNFSGIELTGDCTLYSDNRSYDIKGYNVGSDNIRIAGDVIDKTVDDEWESCTLGTALGPLYLITDTTVSLSALGGMSLNGFNLNGHALNIEGGVSVSAGSAGTTTTGAGSITLNNTTLKMSGLSTYSGLTAALILNNSNLTVGTYNSGQTTATSLPTGSGAITIGDGSSLTIDPRTSISASLTSLTIPNSITIQGPHTSARIAINFVNTQESDVTTFTGSTYGAYRYQNVSGKTVAFTGTINLSADLSVFTNVQTTFSGNISGAGRSIVPVGTFSYYSDTDSGGPLIISAGSNNTNTANGTYNLANRTSTLAGNQCTNYGASGGIYIGARNKVIVNGTCSNVLIRYGGVLGGSGTVGNITSQGGAVQPGNSPETLNTGNVSLDSTSSLGTEIGGTAAGEFDQLNVTGTVSLGSASLNISHWNSYVPVNGDSFTIINNDGTDAVTGTFTGLAEGASIIVGDVTYTISYVGGTGNDVVLTTFDSPGPPNTAGVFSRPINLLLPAGIIITGGVALLLRSRLKRLGMAIVRRQ